MRRFVAGAVCHGRPIQLCSWGHGSRRCIELAKRMGGILLVNRLVFLQLLFLLLKVAVLPAGSETVMGDISTVLHLCMGVSGDFVCVCVCARAQVRGGEIPCALPSIVAVSLCG